MSSSGWRRLPMIRSGRSALRLRQRGERLAGADLEIDTIRVFRQPGEAVGEMYGLTQVRDPICGVCGLVVGEPIAAAVGHDRDLRGASGMLRRYAPKRSRIGSSIRLCAAMSMAMRRVSMPSASRRAASASSAACGPEATLRPGALTAARSSVSPSHGRRSSGRERHAEHPAFVNGIKELPAQMHQPDAILEAHHPGEASGGILAHRMADEGGGPHPPALPQLRQRVFGDHDQRQLHRGRGEPRGRRFHIGGVGQPQRADVVIEFGREDIEPAIHPVGEDRFGLV